MINNKITFTIITVCYNSEKTIKSTINSVLNQTEKGFEYIIIDGKSTDLTVKIIESFEDKFQEKNIPFQWISEEDSGIYEAFNKGIRLASTQWISFLGSDDIYVENAIEIYKKNIPFSDIDFLYSNVKLSNRVINGKWSWKAFKNKMNLAHVGAFHSINYFNKYGLFNTSYKIAGDYELLLRAKQNLKTQKIKFISAVMGNQGVSNKQIKKVFLETTRAKIETGGMQKNKAWLSYFIWMLKFQIKKILYVFIR